MDRVHFPAGTRGIALIGSTTAFSFLRFNVFFNEYFLWFRTNDTKYNAFLCLDDTDEEQDRFYG